MNLCNNQKKKTQQKTSLGILQKYYAFLYPMFCFFRAIGEILPTLGTRSLASNMSSTRTASRARNPPERPWSADVIRSWQTVFASYEQKYENRVRALRIFAIPCLGKSSSPFFV